MIAVFSAIGCLSLNPFFLLFSVMFIFAVTAILLFYISFIFKAKVCLVFIWFILLIYLGGISIFILGMVLQLSWQKVDRGKAHPTIITFIIICLTCFLSKSFCIAVRVSFNYRLYITDLCIDIMSEIQTLFFTLLFNHDISIFLITEGLILLFSMVGTILLCLKIRQKRV